MMNSPLRWGVGCVVVTLLVELVVVGVVRLTQSLSAQAPVEQGYAQQFWQIHEYPIKSYGVTIGTIRVFKFQVRHQMACKALFFAADREKILKGSGTSNDNYAVATAISLTATSLGDVPCD